MTAIFGSPVSAVILAVELLLFELRPRSLIPVALACATAAGARGLFFPPGPVFPMPVLSAPSGEALTCYIVIGALVGVMSVGITKLVYWVEDAFEHIPVHWMWWPAVGGLVVGVVGYFSPHTLGVGYDNIQGIVAGKIAGETLLTLCVLKLVSWSIALGSGTSGGTLAPLFTIGGGGGAILGTAAAAAMPHIGIDPRIAALVGMASIFAGASRALLASIVFAFETTLQPMGLLPLLGGCTAAYFVSCVMMRHTIMTEKIARRGIRVPSEYVADYLDQITVEAACVQPVVTLLDTKHLGEVRAWLKTHEADAEHQGFPVVNAEGHLVGVVTRRGLLDALVADSACVRDLIKRPPAVVFPDLSLRDAADHMVREGVGRLPVVTREERTKVIGIITRSDLLSAHKPRLQEMDDIERSIRVRSALRKMRKRALSGKSPRE
jgi:CBS domain-containing protein